MSFARVSETRVATRSFGLWMAAALVTAALLLRVLDPERIAWVQAAFIVYGSLVIQAAPFVLIGAVAAAFVEVFVPIGSLERLAKLPRWLQLPAAALAGLAFPICECGSVPLARRLMAKGLMPAASITFMLAAPVVNPVVIASTYFAFKGRDSLVVMVAGRFVLGLLVAIVVGWSMQGRASDILRPGGGGAPADPIAVPVGRPEARWRVFLLHTGGDFLLMGRFLLIGAAVAAVVQTFLPQSLTSAVAGVPIVSVVVMMLLAFALSLCSESDAFIAASFTPFGVSGQLAFLVFGPMVDLKLIAIYAGTFRPRAVRTLVLCAAAATFAGALWIGVFAG